MKARDDEHFRLERPTGFPAVWATVGPLDHRPSEQSLSRLHSQNTLPWPYHRKDRPGNMTEMSENQAFTEIGRAHLDNAGQHLELVHQFLGLRHLSLVKRSIDYEIPVKRQSTRQLVSL
jgi:hypothetical protein